MTGWTTTAGEGKPAGKGVWSRASGYFGAGCIFIRGKFDIWVRIRMLIDKGVE